MMKTTAEKIFVKRNDAKKFPGMFNCESEGLQMLNEAVNGITPKIISVEEHENEMVLTLEHIETGIPQKEFWNDFAKKLVTIHRQTSDYFGLDHDNYIGLLPQSNTRHNDWISFFILERIEAQLKKAIDENRLPKEIHRVFEKMFSRLGGIFPEEKPSLLHGDLWSGNYLIAKDGLVRLIDPAVYFGFREMDLAMMKLFGGFDASFFEHYLRFFPLEKGFEERVEVCNLYPLLVHVNLFGGHYTFEVQDIMKQFKPH
jgi:fructosamine-3-kinase